MDFGGVLFGGVHFGGVHFDGEVFVGVHLGGVGFGGMACIRKEQGQTETARILVDVEELLSTDATD